MKNSCKISATGALIWSPNPYLYTLLYAYQKKSQIIALNILQMVVPIWGDKYTFPQMACWTRKGVCVCVCVCVCGERVQIHEGL